MGGHGGSYDAVNTIDVQAPCWVTPAKDLYPVVHVVLAHGAHTGAGRTWSATAASGVRGGGGAAVLPSTAWQGRPHIKHGPGGCGDASSRLGAGRQAVQGTQVVYGLQGWALVQTSSSTPPR